MEPVILIDVMNLVFRCHFAHQHLTAEGKHTGVQYGVLKTVHDLRENVSKRMIFCWDHGVPVPGAERPKNWREKILPTYKATRTHNHDVYKLIVPQLDPLAFALMDLGYSHISVMGLEADDIIGILSRSLRSVLIFSTDQDFYQLLSPSVKILVPKKDRGKFKVIQQSDVEQEYGIGVERWAAYLALGGDKSDNIKALRGMGPKTAIRLVLDGALPALPFTGQSADFRLAHVKYEDAWPDIQKSYHAAQIPTSCLDLRIQPAIKAAGYSSYTFASVNADQTWRSDQLRKTSMTHFEQFLSSRNMLSLLHLRHKFFDTSEPVIPTAKPVTRRVSLV